MKAESFIMIFDSMTLGQIKSRPGMVAHACDTSYSGGRDWEDHGLKPTWTKS
jgi:hypothetical protein